MPTRASSRVLAWVIEEGGAPADPATFARGSLAYLLALSGCSLLLDPDDLVGDEEVVQDAGAEPDASSTEDGGSDFLGIAIDIAAGNNHTCAIRDDRAVFCWGQNGFGQSGQPPITTSIASPTRVDLGGVGAARISLGTAHSCALLVDGTIRCWGLNSEEENRLGNTDFVENRTHEPQQVSGIADAADLDLGIEHGCALIPRNDELPSVRCWGQNERGELGTGCDGPPCMQFDGSRPVILAPALSAMGEVAAGAGSSCAITDGADVACWGVNEGNQLGLDGADDPASPTVVSGLGDIVRVAAGGGAGFIGTGSGTRGHICAIDSENQLYCWGANDRGQAAAAEENIVTVPQLQDALEEVTQVAPGSRHTCALHAGGRVTCWGESAQGQTTLPEDRRGASNDAIELGEPATHVSAGRLHSCAILESGEMRCWGENSSGRLGPNADVPEGAVSGPVTVELPPIEH